MRSTNALLLLGSAALALAAPPLAAAAEEGAQIVEEACSSCHTPKVRPIDKMHFTRNEWAEAIERMAGMGVEVPKKKIPELLDYLVRNHGPNGGSAAPAGGTSSEKK
jgi:cytochrome c5